MQVVKICGSTLPAASLRPPVYSSLRPFTIILYSCECGNMVRSKAIGASLATLEASYTQNLFGGSVPTAALVTRLTSDSGLTMELSGCRAQLLVNTHSL